MGSVRIIIARWIVDRAVPIVFRRVNPLIVRALESPLHPLLSWYVTVVRFRGRLSLRSYRVPFTYHRIDHSTVEGVTSRQGIWWRNLKGGSGVEVLSKGRWLSAHAEVSDDMAVVSGALWRRDWPRRLMLHVPPEESVSVRVTLVF